MYYSGNVLQWKCTTVEMYYSGNVLQWKCITVEPPNKGHFGTNHSVTCRDAVLFSEVENVLHIHFWGYRKCPLYGEVVPFLEGLYWRFQCTTLCV